MKYFSWLWNNSRGIRWNTVVRIIAGIIQVVLSLLMVWLSKRFIDETIRTGTADDVLRMVELLVLTVVGGVILRQVVLAEDFCKCPAVERPAPAHLRHPVSPTVVHGRRTALRRRVLATG